MYGTPWDFHKGHDLFFNGYGGWPCYAVAMNLVRLIKSRQLPQLRKYMTAEKFAYYEEKINNCTGFMDLGVQVYCKMYAHHYTTY